MSKFVVGECVFNDLDDLTATMESLFGAGSVERSVDGSNSLTAYGHEGDSRDYEIGKVAAVVRRSHISHLSNDLPIIRDLDGTYRVAVSKYDIGAVPRRLGWKDVKDVEDLLNRIKQAFSVRQTVTGMAKLGFKLETETTADGVVHVRAQKYMTV